MPVQLYNPDGTPIPEEELKDYVHICNPRGSSEDIPPYAIRVQLVGESGYGVKTVTVVGETGPGISLVRLVRENPEQRILVANPGSLPFDIKVEMYGNPPCPMCGFTLRYLSVFVLGCDRCRVIWPDYKLEIENIGRVWRPVSRF